MRGNTFFAGRLYPRGAFNAHWFNILNAISFQVMLGAPMILFAKSIGANSWQLGVIASFTPLMTTLQLPAAGYLNRYSYRQFVLMGWSARSIFIYLVAAIPLLTFLGNPAKMWILIGALFCFNFLRGFSSTAWMPWITALIPEKIRGRFISLDQIFVNIGSFLILIFSAVVMQGQVENIKYTIVFLFSATGATLSLYFIRRIPEVSAMPSVVKSAKPVPIMEMLACKPFRELIYLNIVITLVNGSFGVFTVDYLRDIPRFDNSKVLILSSAQFVGAMLSLPLAGRLADIIGSKPVISFSLSLLGGILVSWFLLSAGIIPCSTIIVGILICLYGMAGSNVFLANLRITMSTMPEIGRNHFFALFTMITSLSLGLAPILWGFVIQRSEHVHVTCGPIHWFNYSIYFASLFVLSVIALLMTRRLHERRTA